MVSVDCTFIFVLSVLCYSIVQTESAITCGSSFQDPTLCYGSGAYCCGVFNDQCCWETVYSYWWFWFIWFWVFLLILTCSLWICIRRRRRLALARQQYVVVEQHPQYGSVVRGTSYGQPTYTPAPSYATAQSTYTQAPSYATATAPSYQEKPPPYSAAGN